MMRLIQLSSRISGHPLALFPDFRKLFAGRVVSAVGDKFFTIALTWWVIEQGGENSKFLLGMLMAANMAPIILLGPLLGTIVDRVNKKVCLLAADILRMVLIMTLAFLLYREELTLPLVYLLCIGISSLAPLFESAANSVLLTLTDRDHLEQAVAVNSSVLQLSNTIGAALSGIFLAAVGMLGAFIANSLSFLASFFLVLAVRADLKPVLKQKESYFTQLREGIHYLKNNRPIFSILIIFAASNLFASSMLLFMPLAVRFIFHQSVTWVAVFEGSLAAGAVLTALVMSFANSRGCAYRRAFAGGVVIGAAFIIVAVVRNEAIAAGALFCFGMAMVYSGTAIQALFQREIPEAMKGRFFAIFTTACYSTMPVTLFLNGVLSQMIELPVLITANGMMVMIITVAFLFIPRVETDPALSQNAQLRV